MALLAVGLMAAAMPSNTQSAADGTSATDNTIQHNAMQLQLMCVDDGCMQCRRRAIWPSSRLMRPTAQKELPRVRDSDTTQPSINECICACGIAEFPFMSSHSHASFIQQQLDHAHRLSTAAHEISVAAVESLDSGLARQPSNGAHLRTIHPFLHPSIHPSVFFLLAGFMQAGISLAQST